jgi:hypothetical protein
VPAPALRLPDGALLLHIGLFKTGTTAIQGALFHARPLLAEHGVLHAGSGQQPIQAVLALRGVKPLVGDVVPQIRQWERLVDQVAAAADLRVIVSSEFFADADVETARRAVRELGGPRVHVVVTLRPLTKIMPSQWQQYVRNRARFSYDAWLDGMLKKAPYDKPSPSFWQRHHHDVVVERWASIVEPENVTVVVPDEGDRESLLRTFEDLVGLPRGLLEAEKDSDNRSLTLGEIELVRQINIEFGRRGWSDALYKQVVRQGFALHLQTSRSPAVAEPRITTPQWALDRAAEIGAAAAEKISSLGVRIVGDISTLGAAVLADERGDGARTDRFLTLDAAREAVVGTIISSGVLTASSQVEATSAGDLLRVIRGRVWGRIRGRARPRGEAPPPGSRQTDD